jgi:Na+-transporting methylmalonyl-CoA/oxaloacetate decarboxylase beta subunit
LDCTRQSRDVIKAVKKRLSNRNPVVQLLTLTVSIPLLYLVVKHQVELWLLLPVLWLGQSKQNCEGSVRVHWLNEFDVNSIAIYTLEGDMPAKNR